MKTKMLLIAIISGCLSVPLLGNQQVYDAAADSNSMAIIKILGLLQLEQTGLKDKTESIDSSSEQTMKYSEKVKEYTGKITEYTEKVQDWLGDAKKWGIDNIEELTGIEDLEATCTEVANESIEIGKTLYGVYNVGNNVYQSGYNAYEAFANIDGSIDSIVKSMEELSKARQEIMEQIKTLSYKQSAATCLNEIQKNQSAYSAAQLKMQCIQTQATEQTNAIMLQNQAIRNAEKRYEQTVYDNYQNSRVDMWKNYYKKAGGETKSSDFDFYK